jgi:hypothetical protein
MLIGNGTSNIGTLAVTKGTKTRGNCRDGVGARVERRRDILAMDS